MARAASRSPTRARPRVPRGSNYNNLSTCGTANNLWSQGSAYRGCGAFGCSWSDDYRVFGVVYNATVMSWTLDGVPYHTRPIGPPSNYLVAPTSPMSL